MDSTGSSDHLDVGSERISPGLWSRAYLKLGGMLVRRTPGGPAGSLLGPGGLHTSCACIFIEDETPTITYTYCTLAFSRLVRWFERRHRNFHDHRAEL